MLGQISSNTDRFVAFEQFRKDLESASPDLYQQLDGALLGDLAVALSVKGVLEAINPKEEKLLASILLGASDAQLQQLLAGANGARVVQAVAHELEDPGDVRAVLQHLIQVASRAEPAQKPALIRAVSQILANNGQSREAATTYVNNATPEEIKALPVGTRQDLSKAIDVRFHANQVHHRQALDKLK